MRDYTGNTPAQHRQKAYAWDIRRLRAIMASCTGIVASLKQVGLQSPELEAFLEQCSLNAGLAEEILHEVYKRAGILPE